MCRTQTETVRESVCDTVRRRRTMEANSAGITNSEQLAAHLFALLKANQPDNAVAFIRSPEIHPLLATDCSEAIATVVKFLTNENFVQNAKLYNSCEDVLKVIAAKGSEGEVILELLEVIDTTKNDNMVVSILKGLQVCLLRQYERVRSLEWCLNSIQLYVSDLPLSAEVRRRLVGEGEKFLEEDDEVRRIISFYFYLFLFYEPIMQQIVLTEERTDDSPFRNSGVTRRNVLACFIIQLFNEPFAILDSSEPSPAIGDLPATNPNTYSRKCAISLSQHISELLPDPLHLIGYGERRNRWPYELPETDETIMNAPPPADIFHIEEKAPLTGLSVMFYALIGENLLLENAPKIYRNVYLFEMGLYYVVDLLGSTEDSLHAKGIRLAEALLLNLGLEKLQDDTLELEVHTAFLTNLICVLNVTQVRRSSKKGIELLKLYITRFETVEAKHYHIRRLLQTVNNTKICGYLVTIYKNIIADQLNELVADPSTEISPFCSGPLLRQLLLDHICVIPNGVETDILQQNDLILAALNMLRFLALRDTTNQTKLWDYMDQIQDKFLKPLREALDCSRSHYRLEEKRIHEKKAPSVACDLSTGGRVANEFMTMSTENRLQVLTIGQNTFDLIESLMSRLTECIDMRARAAMEPPAEGEKLV